MLNINYMHYRSTLLVMYQNKNLSLLVVIDLDSLKIVSFEKQKCQKLIDILFLIDLGYLFEIIRDRAFSLLILIVILFPNRKIIS